MSLTYGSKVANFTPSPRKDPKPILPARSVNFCVSLREFKSMMVPTSTRRITEDDKRAFQKRVEKRRRNK